MGFGGSRPRFTAAFLLFAAASDPGGTEAYDPLEGIEEDGRIPYVERPADLPNPSRWRYIPEGRIKRGTVFDRLFITSFIAPFVFKSSDAGWGGGIGVGDIDFRSQNRRETAAIFGSYSENRQQNYGFAWRRWTHHIDLPDGGVLQEERSVMRARASYSKTRTRRFFGFGADAREEAESSYTDDFVLIDLGLSHTLFEPGSDLIGILGTRAELHRLSSGIVGGVPNTGDAFSTTFSRDEKRNMGWLGAGLRFDTRDSQSNPYRGWFVGALVDAALAQTGGDVGAVITVDGSRVFPVPGLLHRAIDFRGEENPPTDTLLVGLRTQFTAGDLPFYSLPTLGGSRAGMHGFIAGRFRDRASWYGTAEYRFWVLPRGFGFEQPYRIERVGLGVFYEAGSVADTWPNLFSASVQHSYGASLVFSIERTWPFRVNLAFSRDGFQFTFGSGLSF